MRVGKPTPLLCLRHSSAAHPHARGETSCTHAGALTLKGTSHARGETELNLMARNQVIGTSPCAWGNLGAGKTHLAFSGHIPMRVGKPLGDMIQHVNIIAFQDTEVC